MDDDTYFSRKDKTRFMKDFETIMDDLWDGKPCEVNFGDVSFTVGDF
jgi:hypothetical protein